MADLAVIRLPAGHGIPPVQFADPAALSTGSEVFLIGFPAETESFPQPTISSGVISRFREWSLAGLSYVQTDAAITGGQSGGALVSDHGAVVGLSGFKFADTFGLALAAPIVDERAHALIDGTSVDAFSDRRFSGDATSGPLTFDLANYYDQRAFVVRGPVGTSVSVTVSSDNDAALDVYDATGVYLTTADTTVGGEERVDFEIDFDVPFIVVANQFDIGPGAFEISGSPGLARFADADDGRRLGRGVFAGNIDYPADIDMYEIDLIDGETITVRVESLNIDPDVTLDSADNADESLAYDDDSAGGLFGTDAEFTFTAPTAGRYLIVVTDVRFTDVGAYYLVIE